MFTKSRSPMPSSGGCLIQMATAVFPFLEIPNWAIELVIVLVRARFPDRADFGLGL